MKSETRFISDSISPAVRTLITWESDIAVNDGYCAACRPKDDGSPQGQFSMAPVHVTDLQGNWAGTYAENQIATRLTNSEMQKIMDMQTPDEKTIDQKANWAMFGGQNTWGAIMRASYPSGDRWREATDIRMIASVYAGQPVEVLERKVITTRFNGKAEVIPMWRIQTYPPSDWHLLGACQYVTAVTAKNTHYERPCGLFRMPIYFGNRLAWVFERWLV